MSSLTIGDASTLPLARRDLQFVPTEYRGRAFWTIKDPIALRYFQLREEEHFILCLLDGQASLDEIVTRFEARFAPRRLKRTELSGFLAMLHREGLVVSPVLGQGEQLLARGNAQRWHSWLSALGNLLAVRLPGVNPDQFLSWLAPRLAWLFTPWSLAGALLLMIAAASIAAVNFAVLVGRLPALADFLGPGNLLWLMVSLMIVKTLHELGHAVACKHFGGACHRIGIMLLVFTPALYSDVSDAWMFPDRRRRMAVSAAGMVVELMLAALATLLWSWTQPGWLNAMSLNVMVVCSVNTLLINGNPLLRYDGYYLLADWLGTPNLQQQASATIRRAAARLLAGVDLETPDFLAKPGPVVLWTYAIASLLYRGLAIVGILWFVSAVLGAQGLANLAPLVGILIVASVAADPIVRSARFLRSPARRERVSGGRVFISALVVAVLLAVIGSIPMPMRIATPAVTRSADGQDVYVTRSGTLAFAKAVGQRVAAGEPLAQLVNRQLELQIADLAGRQAQQRLHVEHLALRQHRSPELADELPTAQQRLIDLSRQLQDKRREQARLSIVAPISGIVLPPPRQPIRAADDQLATFAGIPQDPVNLGCYLPEGTQLCAVGDPRRLEALAVISESDVQFLRPGQRVRLALNQLPGEVWLGRVESISQSGQDLPQPIAAERLVPLQPGADGELEPVGTWYQATISLEPREDVPLVGAVGWARIAVDPQPLWLRMYRAVRGTLRTPLLFVK